MTEYLKWKRMSDGGLLAPDKSDADVEDELRRCLPEGYAFSDTSIRKQFIRKVYLILMAQLLVTFAIVSIFLVSDTLQAFVLFNPIIKWLAFLLLIVTMLAIICFDSVRRTYPTNIIFLMIFTVVESIVLGVIVTQYQAIEILVAVLITSLICFSLTVYATQTRYDFTTLGAMLLVIVTAFLMFSVITLFFPTYTMVMVHSVLGATIFGLYLIFDTQLMLGGNHKYSLSPEEYIFASLNLYLDIINMFIHILPMAVSRG